MPQTFQALMPQGYIFQSPKTFVNDNVFKNFKLSVSGSEDLGVADQWANKVAEKIGETLISKLVDTRSACGV
jgi:hypothetical protein